jgi:DUF971 family protein
MNVPLELRHEPGALTLVWPGGERQRLSVESLRRACPCAGCRRVRLAEAPSAAATREDLALTAIAPMGYGVQLVFSDGHDRGIYPWAWFKSFMPPPT